MLEPEIGSAAFRPPLLLLGRLANLVKEPSPKVTAGLLAQSLAIGSTKDFATPRQVRPGAPGTTNGTTFVMLLTKTWVKHV